MAGDNVAFGEQFPLRPLTWDPCSTPKWDQSQGSAYGLHTGRRMERTDAKRNRGTAKIGQEWTLLGSPEL